MSGGESGPTPTSGSLQAQLAASWSSILMALIVQHSCVNELLSSRALPPCKRARDFTFTSAAVTEALETLRGFLATVGEVKSMSEGKAATLSPPPQSTPTDEPISGPSPLKSLPPSQETSSPSSMSGVRLSYQPHGTRSRQKGSQRAQETKP